MRFLSICIPREEVAGGAGRCSLYGDYDEVRINLSAIVYLRSEADSDETRMGLSDGSSLVLQLPITDVEKMIEEEERRNYLF